MTACKACGNDFLAFRPLAQVCSPKCALKLVKSKKEEDKQKLKARKEKAKPRSKWMQEAQHEFNAYIRRRDYGLPCISCGRHHEGQWHAGHYLSVGARPELRFDESNCYRQCSACNTHLHGNLVRYRAILLQRIGLEALERLEGHHASKKYTIDDLRAIKEKYREKCRELEKGVTVEETSCATGHTEL